MLKTLIFSLLVLSVQAWATPQILVGDIILQPTNCWSCTLIEETEETIYSHMGIVLQVEPELIIGEALGKVRAVSFDKFNEKTEKGQRLALYRYRNEKLVQHIQNNSQKLLALFRSEFEGLAYDHDFLWNNFDEQGEKLYCSEMVGKLLQLFVGVESPIKRMHFSKHRDQWERYFHGNVPEGKWGNSPADFERSDKYRFVGEL